MFLKNRRVKIFLCYMLGYKMGVIMGGHGSVDSVKLQNNHFEGSSDLVEVERVEKGRHHSFTAFVIKEINIQIRAEVRQIGGDLRKIKQLASYCFHPFLRNERHVINATVVDTSQKMDLDTLFRAITRLFASLNRIPIENFMKKENDSLLIPSRASPPIDKRNEFIKEILANPGGFVLPVKPDRSDAALITSTIKKLLCDNPLIKQDELDLFLEIGWAKDDVSQKIENFMVAIDHKKQAIFNMIIDHCLLLEANNNTDPHASSTKMTMENLGILFSPTLAVLNTPDEFFRVNVAFVNLLKDKKREYAV